MKDLHTRDAKNRIQIGSAVKKNFKNTQNKRVCFMGDHIVVCSNARFDEMVSDLAAEIGSKEIARMVLEAESMDFSLDGQGRIVLPKENLTGPLEEKECYVVAVKGKTPEENYLEIFPKTVLDDLLNQYFVGTTFLSQSGIKGELNKLKGEDDEKGRGKN